MGEPYCSRVEEVDALLELDPGRGEELYRCFIWRTQLPLAYMKVLSKIDADGGIEARAVLEDPSGAQGVCVGWTGLSEAEFAWLVWRISTWEAEAVRDVGYWIREAGKYFGNSHANENNKNICFSHTVSTNR